MTYADYLQSPAWQARREWAIALAGGHCALCPSSDRLEVHHSTYDRLGHELPSDLIALCSTCHERVHRYVLPPTPRATEADRRYRRRLAIEASVDSAMATPARAPTRGQIPAGAAHQPASVPTCRPASTATPAPGSIDRREET